MTPLVLLPGMMCTAALFTPQITAFSRERAVQCTPPTEHDTVQRLAASVLASAPPDFALCGLSMGGIVAMEVQRQAPERVTGLALLDTNPLAELEEVKARRGPQMQKVRNGQLLEVMRDEMKPNYLVDSDNAKGILDLCADMAMALGPEVFLTQSLALRDRPDQTQTLRELRTPALVLCGEQDRLCPPERHELMHALMPSSTLAVIAGAGHLPVLEQPDATNAQLAAWLRACDEARAAKTH